jgi:hypothetical protein
MTIYKDSKRIVALEADRTGGSITLDAESNNHASASATSITISGFTVGNNSNKILIVSVGSYNPTPTVSGITWNSSENFTQINTVLNNGRADLWYLVNPTSTTADIVVTYSSSAGSRSAGVTSLYNVNQSTPIGVTNTVTGTGGTIAGTITPTTTGSWIIDSAMSLTGLGAITDTLTAGFSNLIGGVDRSHGTQYSASPTINSANSMTWTNGQSSYAWAGAEIKKAEGDITNVQDNSILVEKDTARRYWFDAESTSDVTWNDSTDVGCSISGNTITKTASNGWTSGIGQTDQQVSASNGGTITITSNATNSFVGLSNVTSLNQQAKTWFDIKFGFSDEEIIENGAQITPDTAFSRATSDTMKITISSAGLVKYYVNDTLKHTSTITASGSYFGIFAAYTQNENMTATITTPATWTMQPTKQFDFSSSAGWTTVGSNITITGGAITANAMVTQTDNRIYYDLGSALSDKFVIDFDHYADSSPAGSYWQMFALTDTTAIPRTDDGIYPLIDMGSWDTYLRYSNEGSETNVGTLGSLTTGQWQYVRFVRDGTTGTLTVYSDSARTIQVLNVSGTIPATVTGLRYFQSGALASANTGTATYKIDNLKIYDGVTSIN